MYLVDTNIFLEVLLSQNRRDICKNFLNMNTGNLYISDFSLHSIGVILFRNNKADIFHKFVSDALPNIEIITLPKASYADLAKVKEKFGLDFDDAYQTALAKNYDFRIVTLDKDFKKVQDEIEVEFL